MPPKMRLPDSMRPKRRSQRVRKLAQPSRAPITIILDEMEDVPAELAPTVVDVPPPVAHEAPAVPDFDPLDDVPIASLLPSHLVPRRPAQKKQKSAADQADDVTIATGSGQPVGHALREESDDCEVFEDCDAEFAVSDENFEGDGMRSDVPVDEDNYEALFGEVAREADEHMSDDDSGDDIWDDAEIPDPVNSEDDIESEDAAPTRTQSGRHEEYLSLGKTFNCPDDFKYAVLRYSLRTKYDVVLNARTKRVNVSGGATAHTTRRKRRCRSKCMCPSILV